MDEKLKNILTTPDDCLTLEISKKEGEDTKSAKVTSSDCDFQASFLCSLDVFQSSRIEEAPKLFCLNSNKNQSTNVGNVNRRRKRNSENNSHKENMKMGIISIAI